MDTYHQKYADQTAEEIQKRIDVKKDELLAIFKQIPFASSSSFLKLAVIGCGDKRFIKGHKDIFERVLKRPVEVTTFDITIEHLGGEEGVVEHDCTQPLPGGPYTITYAHVILKFIDTEKQWDLIKNSYDALESGGLAIHILDNEEYETEGVKLDNGYYTVPLKRWIQKLEENEIKHQEIPVTYGLALVLLK